MVARFGLFFMNCFAGSHLHRSTVCVLAIERLAGQLLNRNAGCRRQLRALSMFDRYKIVSDADEACAQ
jgi:hypothetical protein